MMQIRWSPEAVDSFETICQYVLKDNPAAARRIASVIYDGVAGLARFPSQGRAGRVHGTRELVLSPLPYLVIYRVQDTTVEVLRVLHCAQQWP
jgi:toxin ParE1/3/4